MIKRLLLMLAMVGSLSCHAQPDSHEMLIRIAEIEVYPEYISSYMKYALTVGETSVREEPGVIAIFPMATKQDSTQIRIVEIYRDQKAYEAHIASSHFQTYKQGTLHMVKHLDLVDMEALNPAAMADVFRKMNMPAKKIGSAPRGDISPRTLIVSYSDAKAKKRLLKALKELKAEVIYDYQIISGMAIKKPENMSLDETKARLEQVKGVVNVSYDHIMQLQ